MKDKNLREALGIHGSEDQLCGCSMLAELEMQLENPPWRGEIPMLWKKIGELEERIRFIEILVGE